MHGEYDALLTLARGIEFQQNLSGLPFGVLLLRAPSTRLVHLRLLVPTILDVLSRLSPGQLHRRITPW
jgi:hypothetical protein